MQNRPAATAGNGELSLLLSPHPRSYPRVFAGSQSVTDGLRSVVRVRRPGGPQRCVASLAVQIPLSLSRSNPHDLLAIAASTWALRPILARFLRCLVFCVLCSLLWRTPRGSLSHTVHLGQGNCKESADTTTLRVPRKLHSRSRGKGKGSTVGSRELPSEPRRSLSRSFVRRCPRRIPSTPGLPRRRRLHRWRSHLLQQRLGHRHSYFSY